jgi:hypothetical protein
MTSPNDPTTREAYARGVEAAEAAASWLTCGNAQTARELLGLMHDGDPQVWDFLPARPNLSGEWADDPTPITLARDLTGREHVCIPEMESIADAFEAGVDATFEAACERILLEVAR